MNINITIEKRHLYGFFIVFLFFVLLGFGIAYNTGKPASQVGHSPEEIEEADPTVNPYVKDKGSCSAITGSADLCDGIDNTGLSSGDITAIYGGDGLDPFVCNSGDCTLNVLTNAAYGTEIETDVVALRECPAGQVLRSCGTTNCWMCSAAPDCTVQGSNCDNTYFSGTLYTNYLKDTTSDADDTLYFFDDVSISNGVQQHDFSFHGEIKPDGVTCSNGYFLKKIGADEWGCVIHSKMKSANTCFSGIETLKETEANCPVGTYVTGGGVKYTSGGTGDIWAMSTSYPLDVDSWHAGVKCISSSDNCDNLCFEVYAICI